LGEYNGSNGKGTLKLIVVFKVGFGPEHVGSVLRFSILIYSPQTRSLILKTTKAFLTGRIPGDYNYLKPRIIKSTSNSPNSTYFLKLTSDNFDI
jgi:hypothetical protein